MEYKLKDLQTFFGRAQNAVTKNTRRLEFESKRMKPKTKAIALEAIRFTTGSYAEDAIPLTVRQVHYHLVHAQNVEYQNDVKHYKLLTTIMLRARIGGEIEWGMLTEADSTIDHMAPIGMSPDEAIQKALEDARLAAGRDPWDEMEKHIILISEKRELRGQVKVVSDELYTRLICTRGYGMWTRLYHEANYIKSWLDEGHEVHVGFITDHDPSGLDINRFGASVLKNFWKLEIEDHRVMLNIDQVEEHDLPPAPTKVSDPRAVHYITKFGHDAWEVDALGKKRIQDGVKEFIESFIDQDVWDDVMEENEENTTKTQELADEYLKKIEDESNDDDDDDIIYRTR